MIQPKRGLLAYHGKYNVFFMESILLCVPLIFAGREGINLVAYDGFLSYQNLSVSFIVTT